MHPTFKQLGLNLPVVQAPMAGVQDAELTIAVSKAGGLGSLPCAMLTPETVESEVARIRAATSNPFNLNFFCHTMPDVTDTANYLIGVGSLQRIIKSMASMSTRSTMALCAAPSVQSLLRW